MKRIVLLIAVLMMLLVGCAAPTPKEYKELDDSSLMVIVDETAGYQIYKHKDTGVHYFSRSSAYGKSVCVMVNEDGTPYTGE